MIRQACDIKQLEAENTQLKAALKYQTQFGGLVGQSPAMQEIYRLIQRTAASTKPVLIQTESGTGKNSWHGPFIKPVPFSISPWW